MGNFISTTNLPNNVEVSEVTLNNTPDIINPKDIYENNKLDILVNEKNIDIEDNSDYGLSLESDYELNSIKTEQLNEFDYVEKNINYRNNNVSNIDYDDIDDDNLDNEFREAVYEYFKNKRLKKLFSNKQKSHENLDDIGVYSTYLVEFGTKSKTRRIIENLI